MRVLPCGEEALLIEVDDLQHVLGLHAALQQSPPDGLVDLVPAARTLLVTFDSGRTDAGDLARHLRGLAHTEVEPAAAGHIELPVHYDGPDLADVARGTGLSEREVIQAHTEQTWTVAFGGFAPGFGYLVGEDERLAVPRRSSPRTRVPAGAVGLAGAFTGVYPRESPGGWQLIGRTTATLWDLTREPPALLVPGVRVRFVEVR